MPNKRKAPTLDAVHGAVTESSKRCRGESPRQRTQQQQKQNQQPKPKLKHTGKVNLQQQELQPMPSSPTFAEMTWEEAFEDIEMEKTNCFDVLSTPANASPARNECCTQQVTGNQERMQGVFWNRHKMRWKVLWNWKDTRQEKYFSRAHFMRVGMAAEDADAEAKRQALAFRQSLVKKGVIRPYKTSGVKNVVWNTRVNSWMVKWHEDGKCRTRRFALRSHMDSGMSNQEAKEAALKSAAAFRATVLRNMCCRLPVPLRATGSGASGLKNVFWSTHFNSWQVLWHEDGRRRVRYFAVRRHMDSGMSNEEAKDAALRAAAAFRQSVLWHTCRGLPVPRRATN
mmetsp:Transcript_86193/g.171129  ORF Transcript_86193/g.171129 Transcript_86193/m.171129 type:complete len:341 (-) Transcript_86193:140-1162(-)